jgi:hypothetical protein
MMLPRSLNFVAAWGSLPRLASSLRTVVANVARLFDLALQAAAMPVERQRQLPRVLAEAEAIAGRIGRATAPEPVELVLRRDAHEAPSPEPASAA